MQIKRAETATPVQEGSAAARQICPCHRSQISNLIRLPGDASRMEWRVEIFACLRIGTSGTSARVEPAELAQSLKSRMRCFLREAVNHGFHG
jgi:hypothetical protein